MGLSSLSLLLGRDFFWACGGRGAAGCWQRPLWKPAWEARMVGRGDLVSWASHAPCCHPWAVEHLLAPCARSAAPGRPAPRALGRARIRPRRAVAGEEGQSRTAGISGWQVQLVLYCLGIFPSQRINLLSSPRPKSQQRRPGVALPLPRPQPRVAAAAPAA